MNPPGAVAEWVWIVAVLVAAAAQTVRNLAQGLIGREQGVLAGSCARFMFGLPFAAAAVAAVHVVIVPGASVPAFNSASLAWLACGALFQLAGTAALVGAMRRQTFASAITCAKTEVLQAALFGAVLLGEVPHHYGVAGMCVALLGIWLISRGDRRNGASARSASGIVLGLCAGGGFAAAAVAFRECGGALADSPVAVTSAWCVLLSQVFQVLLLTGWVVSRDPGAWRSIVVRWRVSLAAGAFGVLASVFWFAAFVLRPAADVMALGMVEVGFGYLATRFIFREPIRRHEGLGLMLVAGGAALVCVISF